MKKKLLFEISIIRPLIIFLLVVYHSLCVFTGGWAVPQGVSPNAAYWWMGHLISGFRIETIAFVGGYVFCYQCFELGKRNGFFGFLWKKFKRLIIPCFVFGIVYYLLFRFNPNKFNWQVAFWRVANGIEHLWFLPMLFWCFLVCWLIDRLLQWLHARHDAWFMPVGWFLLAGLAAVSLSRVSGLKLGLSRVPYFLFYFYLGYWLRILLKRNAKEDGSAGSPPSVYITLGSLFPLSDVASASHPSHPSGFFFPMSTLASRMQSAYVASVCFRPYCLWHSGVLFHGVLLAPSVS